MNPVKVNRTPVYEQVFHHMADAIHSKQWKVGEKIPSEIELADLFHVNRLTIRMALQRLISMGLLDVRVGDGTYVKEFSLGDYLDKVTDFYLGPELLDKVCEFRTAIEMASVQLAVAHATEEDVKNQEACCEAFETCKEKLLDQPDNPELFEALVNADYAYHRQICVISHNSLFVYAFDMAKDLILQNIDVVLRQRIAFWQESRKSGIVRSDLHHIVLDGIKEKDLKLAMDAYQKIINYRIKLG
jgi:GntR family transcriptional repressor for pyruvate dehydrogenase complex